MRRPIYVSQRENTEGDFWYAIHAGNGEPVLTSKMYKHRTRAKRAALAFIASIDPAPVHFSYWSGRPDGRGSYRYHAERIR